MADFAGDFDGQEMHDEGFELKMPFITTVSHGGPHDDESYVCGFEMGVFCGQVAALDHFAACSAHMLLHSSNLEQADLIVMRSGYIMQIDSNDGEWAEVSVGRAGPLEGHTDG